MIVRAEKDGERIPLSISDWDVEAATVTVVVMNVGSTTGRLAALAAGDELPTVVGPLGNPTEIDAWGTVLCLAGCYGIGSIYPIARELNARGNRVVVALEARSSYLFYWEDKLRKVADRLFFVTRDGSKGLRGHVGRLGEILHAEQPVHRVIINGCTFLMKRGSDATRPLDIKTIVSLNPIMIDGTGMCGVCRLSVAGKMKVACVDGPDFDGHEIDWEEFLARIGWDEILRKRSRSVLGCPDRTARGICVV